MTRSLAMLRGINVGGHAKVSMADLRATFVDLGYGGVQTFIQSGNVIFDASASPAQLVPTIEKELEARFGFPIKVVVRSRTQLARIITHSPLLGPGRDPARLHVTFLASRPSRARVAALDTEAFGPDEFELSRSEVFVHCPGGYGRTKLNNAFFERALGVTATTRSWKTVTTLADMAS